MNALPLIALAVTLSANAHAKDHPEWAGEPYWNPLGGASVYSDGTTTTTAFYVGAEAGYRYWQKTGGQFPRWTGKTRASGALLLNGGTGLDFRVGSFIGPRWKYLLLQGGPDVFWNRWSAGSLVLDPSIGVDVPVTATVPLDALTLYAGVTPAWLMDADRRVDWSQVSAPGFGHEFAWRAGASVSLDGFGIGVNYSYRVVAGGIQQGFGLSFSI